MKHHSHVSTPKLSQLPLVHASYLAATYPNSSAVNGFQANDAVEKCALARPRRPHHSRERAVEKSQIYAI
ncbi:hypothetical protein AERO9AM_10350 [Aeromicrobium sp. 9AM]|nr:hypothetical protein AERO9AM_10350 [Aeromicrobium sp. 9AM]